MTTDRIQDVIRSFDFSNYGMDDVSYALEADPDAQEWVPALAKAIRDSSGSQSEVEVPATFEEIPTELQEHIEHSRADQLPPGDYTKGVDPFPALPQRVVLGSQQAPIRAFDMFRQIFESQAHFQALLGFSFQDMSDEECVGYLKDQILALTDEAHEALNEIGWKPWASSRHVNRKEFGGELADILCFLINLALGVGLTSEDFYRLQQEKALRNIKRQEDKYDGVSGKCPGCRRDIEDLRVKGLPVGNFGGVDYCSHECIQKINPQLIQGTGIPFFHTNQES